jgi:hypothetical protein
MNLSAILTIWACLWELGHGALVISLPPEKR